MQPRRTLSIGVVPLTLLLALAGAAVAAPAEPGTETDCGTDNLLAGRAPAEQQEISGNVAVVTDGAIGAEGTQWDAPLAVTFSSASASLTYDLGRTRTVSALYVQADANDTYRMLGSTEGTPGSFRTLTTVEDATARGHGLRDRAIRITAIPLRYLRISEASGDGRFSISEFAAYCRLPDPFPPAMKAVDAPLAEASRVIPEKTTLPEEPGASRFLLFLAVVLAAFGVGGMLWARSPAPSVPGEAPPSSAEGPSAEAASPSDPGPSVARSHEGVLRLMFVASGCAALMTIVLSKRFFERRRTLPTRIRGILIASAQRA